jgi:hypothetical protein
MYKETAFLNANFFPFRIYSNAFDQDRAFMGFAAFVRISDQNHTPIALRPNPINLDSGKSICAVSYQQDKKPSIHSSTPLPLTRGV